MSNKNNGRDLESTPNGSNNSRMSWNDLSTRSGYALSHSPDVMGIVSDVVYKQAGLISDDFMTDEKPYSSRKGQASETDWTFDLDIPAINLNEVYFNQNITLNNDLRNGANLELSETLQNAQGRNNTLSSSIHYEQKGNGNSRWPQQSRSFNSCMEQQRIEHPTLSTQPQSIWESNLISDLSPHSSLFIPQERTVGTTKSMDTSRLSSSSSLYTPSSGLQASNQDFSQQHLPLSFPPQHRRVQSGSRDSIIRPNIDHGVEPVIVPRSSFKSVSTANSFQKSSWDARYVSTSQPTQHQRYNAINGSEVNFTNGQLRASAEYHKSLLPIPISSSNTNMAVARQEFLESPRSKLAYKEFCKHFRIKEKESLHAAQKYAFQSLAGMPDNARWRVYMEMADLAKRHQQIQEAREYYSNACECQPKASICFLEWSKMEEENGRLRRALNVLVLGLKVCVTNEAILNRVIKLQERLHKSEQIRSMLGGLHSEPTSRIWKSILEGALFEARTGNIVVSRKILQFLMLHVPWYGPIYFEAFRLEERKGDDVAAFDIVKRGLAELPRYGPLWFGLMRIVERLDIRLESGLWRQGCEPDLLYLNREACDAVKLISKELTWKVYFEKSQAEERAVEIVAAQQQSMLGRSSKYCKDKLLVGARESLLKSLLVCPSNLRWKVLLVGARLELSVGSVDTSRRLLQRAFSEVPAKSKAYVYLECSRLEEFEGNIEVGRDILSFARHQVSSEWKVFLEAILLEWRDGDIIEAINIAKHAVKVHSGAGRLWAMYIQLHHRAEMLKLWDMTNQVQQQQQSKESVLMQAISQVPKSGEVWCEQGRCMLNPLNIMTFNLCEAQRAFSFAIQFTPQYGDTFIECIRLEMLCQILLPQILSLLRLPVTPFIRRFLSEDLESDTVDLIIQLQKKSELFFSDEQPTLLTFFDRQARRQAVTSIENYQHNFGNSCTTYSQVILESLYRRCTNADPNYGTAWFHCRDQPFDISTQVLCSAVNVLAAEVIANESVYARAVMHFVVQRVSSESATQKTPYRSFATKFVSPVKDHRETQLKDFDSSILSSRTVLTEFMADVDLGCTVSSETAVGDSLERLQVQATDFVTGLVRLNRTVFSASLTDDEKLKILFCSDQIIS